MAPSLLPVIRRLSFPLGTPAFEAARQSLIEEFSAKVPREYHISSSIIDHPPKNVIDIPRESGILSQEEINITENFDAVALAAAIAARKFTAVVVATAFAKRAIIAHQLTCCLTEWFMEEAIDHARALDEHLVKTGTTVGPLHGVPISVKEMIPVAGHHSSLGFLVTRHKDESDSHMIAILRKAGAVFYCKTAQPQGVMHLETVSLHGRVLNPYNIDLTAGGSTGGAAALLALRGSVLSVGTDIGGSIRAPASFCGLYGFKPTSYTLPMKGFVGADGFAAELNVLASAGPLGVSLRDMDFFVAVVKAAQPHLEDPRLVPIAWRGLAGGRPKGATPPLRVGFMMNDGVITPQPPVTRALDWARARLSGSPDFEVKDFAPYRVGEALRNIQLAFFPDGGRQIRDALAATGEPMLPLTQSVIREAESAGQDLDAAGVLRQRVARDDFRCAFAAHWNEAGVDVVVCPAYVGPACVHETGRFWNYTALWNYVDYPGAVVPTPIRALGKGAESYGPGGDDDDEAVMGAQDELVRRLWAEGDFEGAPVGIQVVARKYHDNDLFAALGAMEGPLGLGRGNAW
ncbi:Putative amidase signature domain-containing protein [Colletotrichum destructivum]|uniref:Amidase signature domain-containing protein n=1 Tax=Colletotrichum destructivum TaxID=34406 RepID=A0AAX4IZ80_9PEZI|nr:Putative amidase signature domain-containing protein [Colletotrichum destructivum]